MSYLAIDTSKTMSYEEPDTWSIAKVAHDKLVTEAGFADHDLRKIVAHATLYDRLLDEYYSTSPPPSPPSPKELALEPIPQEKTIALETKVDQHLDTVIEQAELSLVKVVSHSDNMIASYAEISVEEVEVFDDD